MDKILIHHLTGSRANQVDQFPGIESEIIFGREPGVSVQYDDDRDDLISRQHAKIVVNSGGEICLISDLQSRNGTFLNQQRLFGSARLSHNDVVQLGAGGPEFRFELEPPPTSTKPTRLVGTGSPSPAAMTRESVGNLPAPRPIGRATVEHMLDVNFSKVKSESNKMLWFALGAAVLVLIVGLVFYLKLKTNAELNQQLVVQQRQLLQQMDSQLKQQPGQAAAMREQLVQLDAEVKTSEQRNIQAISKLAGASVTAQQRLPAAEQQVPPTSTPQASSASPPASPAPPPVSPSPVRQVSLSYDQQVQAVLGLIKSNPDQAVRDVTSIVSQYPNRWESFAVAGIVLRSQNQLAEAKVAYQRALGLAPDQVKPQITAAIQQIDAQSVTGVGK